jgi:hypothetical protein
MKRYTCAGCHRQRGQNRLIRVELRMGTHELPMVTMRGFYFCGPCIHNGVPGSKIKEAAWIMLSPFGNANDSR